MPKRACILHDFLRIMIIIICCNECQPKNIICMQTYIIFSFQVSIKQYSSNDDNNDMCNYNGLYAMIKSNLHSSHIQGLLLSFFQNCPLLSRLVTWLEDKFSPCLSFFPVLVPIHFTSTFHLQFHSTSVQLSSRNEYLDYYVMLTMIVTIATTFTSSFF